MKRCRFSDHTLKLIDDREKLRLSIFESGRCNVQFTELNKLTKRENRKYLREYRTKLAGNIMETGKPARAVRKLMDGGH
jgi:hypothetical protein